MLEFPYKTKRNYDLKELNKKVGKLIFTEPGDSDINEGNFMAQLSFFDGKTIYVITEFDVRKFSSVRDEKPKI